MPEFKEGDVVKLKSGGPEMTVSKIKEDDLRCKWFNEKGELKTKYFKTFELEKYQGPTVY